MKKNLVKKSSMKKEYLIDTKNETLKIHTEQDYLGYLSRQFMTVSFISTNHKWLKDSSLPESLCRREVTLLK